MRCGPFRWRWWWAAAVFAGLRKKPLELTAVQKAGVRARLRRVDSVIDAVRASGVRCEQLHELKDYPRESEMTDDEKYKVFSKKHDGYWKPVHWVAKWTKTHLPRRFPPGLHPVAENEIVDTWK
ncbi:MAG: 60s ribosomal protein l31 [Olpidium bornovanus]|uniref:60s ribosomal protein l31 n=1 Tax=Olpidium bornovanus TaxID=278681 RepID=A0A8H7ZY86_9FUNG|nr:MAG: 60s ribosomal protein l31 [Olpidium bornovanus]